MCYCILLIWIFEFFFWQTWSNIISFIKIVVIQYGIKSKDWELAYYFDALANVWATKLVCLLTKLILKFASFPNILLHSSIILPSWEWLVQLHFMALTTSKQSSSMTTLGSSNSLNQLMASYAHASASCGGGTPLNHIVFAFWKEPRSFRIHIPIPNLCWSMYTHVFPPKTRAILLVIFQRLADIVSDVFSHRLRYIACW
jgi:hypothetical protein